jgi:hypothetical protein
MAVGCGETCFYSRSVIQQGTTLMPNWSPKIRSKVLSIGVVRAASRRLPKRQPIAVYELSGTFRLFDITSGVRTDNWFKSNLADRFQWIAVPYKAEFYPMKKVWSKGSPTSSTTSTLEKARSYWLGIPREQALSLTSTTPSAMGH